MRIIHDHLTVLYVHSQSNFLKYLILSRLGKSINLDRSEVYFLIDFVVKPKYAKFLIDYNVTLHFGIFLDRFILRVKITRFCTLVILFNKATKLIKKFQVLLFIYKIIF